MKKRLLSLIVACVCSAASAFGQDCKEHIVRRGETFALIAKRYGMTEQQVKDANPQYQVCYAGLKLQIPQALITTETTRLTAEASKGVESDDAKMSKKKNKKSFWKTLGEITSVVGDAVVTTADVMSETGVLDDTGDVGAMIGGTADLVNMSRGKESNYLDEATEGEYGDYSGGSESAPASVDQGDLQALKNRRAQAEEELRQVNAQIMAQLKQSGTSKGRGFSKQNKKYRNVANSPLEGRRQALDREIAELNTQIALLEGTYEELQESRAERAAEARETNKALKAKGRQQRIDAATYPLSQKAADAAREQNTDIVNNASEWVDAHGAHGTGKIIEQNVETIHKHKKQYKSK